ncbi:MAG: transcription-repair coupling factor [Pseudomonadota bacterium]
MPVTEDLLARLSGDNRPKTISNALAGSDVQLLAALARARHPSDAPAVLHIALDDSRMLYMRDQLAFFAPDVEVITLPAWDCLPYDRVSPNADLSAARIRALAALRTTNPERPRIIVTTLNAASQRVVPRAWVDASSLSLKRGDTLSMESLAAFLTQRGYMRATTVNEPGDFAIRGGLADFWPSGSAEPVRVDFFGDEIDSLRAFDPISQRTTHTLKTLHIVPASELDFSPDAIRRFRKAYVELFGTVMDDDPIYEAASEGRRAPGIDHWMPLFFEQLETILDVLSESATVTVDADIEAASAERFKAVQDYYETRKAALSAEAGLSSPYKPLPPDKLYVGDAEWKALLSDFQAVTLTPFDVAGRSNLSLGAKAGRNFAPERKNGTTNIYDAVTRHFKDLRSRSVKPVIVAYSDGAADRLTTVLGDHGVEHMSRVVTLEAAKALPQSAVGMAVLPLEQGLEFDGLGWITEQDILGDRLIRKARKTKKAENFLTEVSQLSPGDHVVHVDHGIGRFEGLQTIEVHGAPHDCVWLRYASDASLYVPVENIDVLSRFSGEDAATTLDKLGGAGWQNRKARAKQRIREIADELIKIAAARELRKGEPCEAPEGLYDEFCARFPYDETDDQLSAIEDTLGDMASGRPMDRLVCGDVGFGKTEVALRAAFVAAMTGKQVAVICPTTLLARQHYKTFQERFRGWPLKIGQLSRLVATKQANAVKAGMADGDLDIVIGTHALLGKNVTFDTLGLVIVDEEQHFGVNHKERLKQLRANVHVLTLTATPIPRTLQLALSGLRELSIIATPPVDRLAVRTFVTPFDDMVLREALLREHYRGGQSFFVVPRISDLEEASKFLEEHVPEIKFVIGHGQMPSGQLEDVMNAFYDGKYDVLLSTTIVESGLDIPSANTLVVYRADMFGLAQLYQIRGRVGRSKARAYAYLTTKPAKRMTVGALKRLEVLQSLDTLGAGFTLASHDMDLRGAGNLLGDEQSGHIKEVGVELYQQMLEEAVAAAKGAEQQDDDFSPQINLGLAVLIPESYVPDLQIRMNLYRRIASVDDKLSLDGLAAELIDRFGPIPEEAEQLLKVVEIKQLCREAGIAKLEAGAKGITLSFHNNQFANPAGLVDFISNSRRTAKLRPDHRLVVLEDLASVNRRAKVALQIVKALVAAAQEKAAA